MKIKTILNNMHNQGMFYELPWALALMFIIYFICDFGIAVWLAFVVDAETYKDGVITVKLLSGFVGFILGTLLGNSFWQNRKKLVGEAKKLNYLDKVIYIVNKEKEFISKIEYNKTTQEDWNLFDTPIIGQDLLSNEKIKEISIIRQLYESAERGRKLIEKSSNENNSTIK
jgi:hypothetical protein